MNIHLYVWGENTGTGYLTNLNQQGVQSYSGSFNQTVGAGQTYLLNIIYGTDVKQEDVN